MAINKKLIHFKNKENFNLEVANGNILDTSIVFILDTREIWTHGCIYSCSDWVNEINNLLTQIDTLVNADATTAINTFNEIIAFLEGIENSEDLDSIIAAIELQIANTNTNLANYLLKTDAENTYLSKSEASMTYQPVGNYITSIPEEYITESELIAKNYVDSDTMTTELAKKLDVIEDLEEIRSLSNSALQAIPSEYITEEELNNKIQVVETTPAELPTDSIVFIQDSKEISVNGTVYKTVNWSVLEPVIIEFTITLTTYNETVTRTAEEGMTWEEWVNSDYSSLGGPYGSLVYILYNKVTCESYNIELGDTPVLPTDIIQKGAAYKYKGGK